MLTTTLGAVAVQAYYGLPMLIISIIVVAIVYRAIEAHWFYIGIDLVREKPGGKRFGLWTRLMFYIDCPTLYHDVWHKFSKIGKPVLVPTLGTRREIFLPHTSMKWATAQPAKVLGMWDAFSEMFQLGHSLGDVKYMTDTWPHMLSRQVLTHELDDHMMAVHEEVQVAVDRWLGQDMENWQEKDLLDAMRMMITQVGSRFTIGLPLCRNEEYLREIMATVDSIVANAGATGFFPESIRYYVGRIICWSTHRRIDRLTRWYTDEFRERIHKLETNAPDQKVDLLQKMLRFARKNRPEELAVEQMTRRLCMTNLAFIYLASFTMTNIFSNVLSSDARHDTIAKLREEAETWLAKYPDDPRGLWTRSNTNQMVRADSVMREALRINTVPTRAIVRKVMIDGLVTDAGLKLPKDSLISFVSQPMHTDPERWTDPDTYDPFRFVRLREEEEEGRRAQALPEDAGGQFNPHSFLSTASLLVFGRGKNACPGRFLMDFQLKMVINYIVSNYDLRFAEQEPIERPPLPWTLEFIFPAKGVKFDVRRRKRISTPAPAPAPTPAAPREEEEEAVGSS